MNDRAKAHTGSAERVSNKYQKSVDQLRGALQELEGFEDGEFDTPDDQRILVSYKSNNAKCLLYSTKKLSFQGTNGQQMFEKFKSQYPDGNVCIF